MAKEAEEALRAAFASADPDHFYWQTTAPFVSDRERELCEKAFLPLGERVLDLGCGEGATLYHLNGPPGAVGIDLFEDKLKFAEARLPHCRFVVGSACELPFEAGSFDHVLVRDVIHHIEEPERLVRECLRVLAPKGRVDVLEPCRYNPLILMHAITKVAERGELRSTPAFLKGLFSQGFRIESTEAYQAFPIHRLVFHPDLGKPAWANESAVRAAVNSVEHLAERLMPRWSWAYIHLRAFVT